jgi:tetratricopeptide (TPR) repeat protein
MTLKEIRMKTKIILLTIGLLGFGQVLNAQDYNCDEAYIILNDALKSKDYPRAYQFWQFLVAGTCDEKIKEKSTIITNGGAVIGKMIKASEGDQQAARLDSLYFNYQKGIDVLGRVPKVVESFGGAYARYEAKGRAQETHDLLNESIEALQFKSKSSSVRYYYTSCFYLYQDKKIDKAAMVNEYLRLDPICDQAMASPEVSEKAKGQWQSTKEFLLSIAKNFLTCEVITEVYQPRIEADPENNDLLKEAFKLLDDAKCEKTDATVDFYLSVLDKLLGNEPSAEGYYGMANLQFAKGKKSEASATAEKAYTLAQDDELKRKIILVGVNCASSKWYGVWMTDFPSDGEPWLNKAAKVAKQVTNTALDANLTKRKLVYAKAIEYCNKAKSLDSSVASKASKMIEGYKSNLPACDELFQLSISKGDVIKLGSLGSVTVMCN